MANRSGLDQVLIAAIFRDVAAYLDRDEIRELVLDTVLATTPAPRVSWRWPAIASAPSWPWTC